MLIGTFGLGIPAIALTGSYYLHTLLTALFPAAVEFKYFSKYFFLTISGLMIWVAYAVNCLGGRFSGNIQKYLAALLVFILILIPALSLLFANDFHGDGISPINNLDFSQVFLLIGLVFFAFTGWEMLACTIEEYKNPKRDYPISVALSYLIVLLLYLLLVVAIQMIVARDDPLLNTAPLSALTHHVFGSLSSRVVAFISFVIILANLIEVVWAASRLVFSSARAGLLPPIMAKLAGNNLPKMSLLVTCLAFSIILILNHLDLLRVNGLLRLAGQNFFILYGMAVLAYIKISTNIIMRVFGLASLLVVLATMGTFGFELLYPAILLGSGYLLSRYKPPRMGK